MELPIYWWTVCLFALSSILVETLASTDDFYSLLDIAKSASTKDIRKAFKKMALKMHPDKNIDDPDADDKFIRINRAYEVLKDEELRKKYDQFGEEGLENNQSGRGYQSWSYYRDNFGIYDDDPEIITLSRTDFEASVSGSNAPWFINYYHPMCSHCHTLAPDWRWLSFELQGVVRIGAVNCDDEFHLCSEQGIHSYPTLLAYPGRDKFRVEKSRDNLVSFILNRLPTGHGIPITAGMLHNMRQQHNYKQQSDSQSPTKPWVVGVFHSREQLEEHKTLLMKMASIFSGVVSVGRAECYLDAGVCRKLNRTSASEEEDGVLLYYPGSPVLGGAVPLGGVETAQAAATAILALMPQVPLITAEEYKERLSALVRQQSGVSGGAWLVQFTSEGDEQEVEFRKLGGLLSPLLCHRVLCSSLPDRHCDTLLYLTKTPAFVLYKPGGGYELHQGRLLAQDIANFAREAAAAPHFRTLTPKEFPSVLSSRVHWFVDFYAPWCPPCMRLLPHFRQASVMMQRDTSQGQTVNFGIIDCTAHGPLCAQFNVRSYPTTILYNHTTPHQYSGQHSPRHMVDFVKDTLNPTVMSLTQSTFPSLVERRGPGELWVVDFFAAWCGPCQAMAPEYRRFSRLVSGLKFAFIASVDCATERTLCQQQGVHSYPTIRLYGGDGSVSTYSDYSRDAESFKRWFYSHLPSKVVTLTDRTYEDMLRSRQPWLVDFFAPWCGHCHQFAPDFEDLATSLEGSVQLGKVDCQDYQWLCRGAGVSAYPTVVFYKGLVDGDYDSDRNGGDAKHQRQNPRGETIQSLDRQAILSHVQWRIEEKEQHEPKSRRGRDEL